MGDVGYQMILKCTLEQDNRIEVNMTGSQSHTHVCGVEGRRDMSNWTGMFCFVIPNS